MQILNLPDNRLVGGVKSNIFTGHIYAREAYKPDSVLGHMAHGRPFLWAGGCPPCSSCQPEPAGRETRRCAVPIWHCSRWGLPSPVLLPDPRWAFTPPFHLCLGLQGSLLSVALSLGFPPPGVTWHRCFRESGLSSTYGRGRPAPRALWRYTQGVGWSTGYDAASADISVLSVSSSGPLACGRNLARKAVRTAVSPSSIG